jgi:hypothetical protein
MGSIESGPSLFFMTVTTMVLFGPAFFTDVIGGASYPRCILGWVHRPPRGRSGDCVDGEGGWYGFNHILATRMLYSLTFGCSDACLQYFTLSGLSTDLGLLDNGVSSISITILC